MSELANMNTADEVAHFIEQCAALAATPCTADSAPKFRALQAEEVKLRKKVDSIRVAEKEPHLQAGRAVDATYQPMIVSLQDACKAITRALTTFLEAEDARLREEARKARERAEEENRRAAQLAAEAEAESDPFDAFDKGEEARRAEAEAASMARQAAAPVKASVSDLSGGRAGGLRTVGWIVEVEDPSALVAHYAHRSEMLELAQKLCAQEAKATKGQCKVPGVKILADRRAA